MGNHIHEIMVSLLEKRRSIRNFVVNNSLSQEALYDLVETSKKAPMAGGIDSTCVMVFSLCDDKIRKLFYRATFYQQLVLSAHYVAVFVGDEKKLAEKYSGLYVERFCCQNATIQAYNFILLAESMNIRSCFVGGIREELLNASMGNMEGKRIYALVFV